MVSQTVTELIEQRRRQVLIHSCLYYRLDTNIVSDSDYDQWCKELAELQVNYPEEAAKASYHEEFREFDGSTGFDLPTHYPEVYGNALHLLEYHKNRK